SPTCSGGQLRPSRRPEHNRPLTPGPSPLVGQAARLPAAAQASGPLALRGERGESQTAAPCRASPRRKEGVTVERLKRNFPEGSEGNSSTSSQRTATPAPRYCRDVASR